MFKALVVAGFSIDAATASVDVVDEVGFSTLLGAVSARLYLEWSSRSAKSLLRDRADMTGSGILNDVRQLFGRIDVVGVGSQR